MPALRSSSNEPDQPESSKSTTPAEPYTRSKPRLQFTACGACRMRRVKCDLKDVDLDSAGGDPACTNCKERNLKCIDEFTATKPTRLLRRGRRIQKVEAIYGKDARDSEDSFRPQQIPNLQAAFFRSKFWRWFSLQHPVLDAAEIFARFSAHELGTLALSKEGHLLMMVIVIWAATYGVNEKGGSLKLTPAQRTSALSLKEEVFPQHKFDETQPGSESSLAAASLRLERQSRFNAMLTEFLDFVDLCGLVRTPTWDGVRVLFLLYPLLDDITNPGVSLLRKENMYEIALSQARVLCTMTTPSPPDAAIRARIFWYLHLEDSIRGGLEGRRLIFSEEDRIAFESSEAHDYPVSNGFISSNGPNYGSGDRSVPDRVGFSTCPGPRNPFFTIPIRIGTLCRKIYASLLSLCAQQRKEPDADAIYQIWSNLDHYWLELGSLLESGPPVDDDQMDVERFVFTWRLMIFRCHNRIREALKDRASTDTTPVEVSYQYPSSSRRLYTMALDHCNRLLPQILHLIQSQLSYDRPLLFRLDYGLVEEAVFFAGVLTADDAFVSFAQSGSSPTEMQRGETGRESVKLCLRALSEIQWLFSKKDKRVEAIRLLWSERCQTLYTQPVPTSRGFVDGPRMPIPSTPVHSSFFQRGIDSEGHTPLHQTPPQLFATDRSQDLDNAFSSSQESDFFVSGSRPATGLSEPGQCHVLNTAQTWTSYTPPNTICSKDSEPHGRPSLAPLTVSAYFAYSSAPNTSSSSDSFPDPWAYSPPATGSSLGSTHTQPLSPTSPYGNGMDPSGIVHAASPTDEISGSFDACQEVQEYSKLQPTQPPAIYEPESTFSNELFGHFQGAAPAGIIQPPQAQMMFVPTPST